jgi:hypothetical protein
MELEKKIGAERMVRKLNRNRLKMNITVYLLL